VGSPIEIGLSTGIAQLLNVLGRFCEAEGLVTSQLLSIQFLEDEIEVVIVRPDGSRRHNIYPLAAVWGATNRGGDLSPTTLPPTSAADETKH
jgi:hypothetical protein